MLSEFIMSRSNERKPITLAYEADSLRSFLRYLCRQGLLRGDFVKHVPKIPALRETVPSVWSQEDFTRLLAAVDRNTPGGRRDYAILLLAGRLGMRIGDIRTLRLDDLRWDELRLETIQAKTGRPLSLPLTEEIGKALINYLRNGRPKTHHREVFLRNKAPFEPFAPRTNLHHMISTYRRRAGIIFPTGRRVGLHSLRHTAASRLLEVGTPLATISCVMGHLSSETTRMYTKIDIEELRSVAMAVEDEEDA